MAFLQFAFWMEHNGLAQTFQDQVGKRNITKKNRDELQIQDGLVIW